MSAALPDDVELFAIQYPGRQDRLREPCVSDLMTLADRIAPRLHDLTGKEPFAFFGHSMGAAVAFETARRLESAGQLPELLFASGRRAPSVPDLAGRPLLHKLSDEELAAEIGRLGILRAEVLEYPELLELALPSIRADCEAIETYVCAPGALLSCPVVALLGERDSWVSVEQARAWAAHTAADFDLMVFPGGHFYLDEPRILAGVAETVSAAL